MSRYILAPQAKRDLNQIVVYVADQAGATTARRVLAEIREAMNLIARRPMIGHLRQDLTHRPYRFWTVQPYFIVYDPGQRPLQIACILHAARDIKHLL